MMDIGAGESKVIQVKADIMKVLPGDIIRIEYTSGGVRRKEEIVITEEMWNDIQSGRTPKVEINRGEN